MTALTEWLGRVFTPWSYPSPANPSNLPPGSQNRDGFERNHDNPLRVNYSDDVVLKLSTVWACVRLLSQTVSTLPINVWYTKRDGSRELANDHPLANLLRVTPNADMTAQSLWEALTAALSLRGNSYAEKHYLGSTLVALDFLKPDAVTVTRLTNGDLEFRYTENGRQRVIPEDRMWHTLGFTLDGRLGLSAIQYGAKVFGAALAGEVAASGTFSRGLTQPTVGFGTERVLSPQQRKEYRKDFLDHVGGAMNAGTPFFLEGGMEPFNLGIKPADAQLLESRAWSVEEICRWFGVPPFMVGHSEKSTSWGTGIEQQFIGFLTVALRPLLRRIENSITRSLFTPAERARFHAEFAIEGLLRADSAARAALYASAGQNGWMTRNEIRALENLPPAEGGDVLTVQSNLVALDKLGDNPPAAAAADALKSWLGLMEGNRDDPPQG